MPSKKSRLLLLATLSISLANAVVPASPSANEINHLSKRQAINTGGALYPQASETRDLKTLDGIWNFRKSPADPEYGYRNGWYERDLDKVRFFLTFKKSKKKCPSSNLN